LHTRSTAEKQTTRQLLLEILLRNNLTVEQIILCAKALYQSSLPETEEQQQGLQSLVNFLQSPNLSFDAIIQMAQEIGTTSLFWQFRKTQQYYQIIHQFLDNFQQEHLQNEQRLEAIIVMHSNSFTFFPNESEKTSQLIIDFLERANLSTELKIKAVKGYYNGPSTSYSANTWMSEKLLELVQQHDISIEQSKEIAQLLIRHFSRLKTKEVFIDKITKLIQQPDLSIEQFIRLALALYIGSSPDSLERQQAIAKLIELLHQNNLSVEQYIDAAQILYQRSPEKSPEELLATTKLVELLNQNGLSIEQHIHVSQALYQSSPYKSPEEHLATQKLVTLLELPDLPDEQRILVVQTLYRCSDFESPERLQAAQELQQQVLNQDHSFDQRIQSALVPITEQDTNYADRAQAINIVFTLADIETAISQIKKQWTSVDRDNIVPTIDIPHLIDLVNDERIPIEIRDEMC
jgi:DNA repair protein RadC